MNKVILRVICLIGTAALTFAAAACGGSSPATTSGPSSTAASASAQGTSSSTPSSSAAQPPASGHSVPIQFNDDQQGLAGYQYRIGLDSLTRQSVVNLGTGNPPVDAPPGQTILVATVTLTNSTSRQEPGVQSYQTVTNLKFAIPCTAAQLVPGAAQTWGTWCDAVRSINGPTISSATPDAQPGSSAPPQLAPGASQQFTLYDGSVPEGIKGVRLLVTGQGTQVTQWELLG